MKFEEWEPLYREICEYFSFDPGEDERAARILEELTGRDAYPELCSLLSGREVTVCGNAPCLVDELNTISGVVIAADAAAGVLIRKGIEPAVIVTDLDGIDEYAVALNLRGTIMVVHAHGDNICRLKSWVPWFAGPVVCTTQGKPFGRLHNDGGFTDGDRAVFMALTCGAKPVRLVGFDLDDPEVTPMKKGKLIWARRLLALAGYDC